MNRKGFGLRAEVREQVRTHYHSDLVEAIKAGNYRLTKGRLTLTLAREFGFCYGVDRAIELAYETCSKFPNRRIFLTTEIIHNPTVNHDLALRGVKFLSGPLASARFEDIASDDVVLVPAFGTTVTELLQLHRTGCTLVDTICGSVVVVWKRVEKYAKDGFTSLIHGKYHHEETRATSSQVLQHAGGHFLIVLNAEQAAYVCDYIVNGGDRSAFLKKFSMAVSPGFDPDQHLSKIGLANQTTMLASESMQIAAMVRDALIKRFGEQSIEEHYRSFDTICSATQERQDAIAALADQKPDLIVVVGGYNSSNTTHLYKMAATIAPSFHIDSVECLVSKEQIMHKIPSQPLPVSMREWLPSGHITIGITSGASTPNRVLGDVMQRLYQFCE